jgi:hypothetical protein
VPYLGYRFYLLEAPNPTHEQLVNELWSQPAVAFTDLEPPQSGYILGVERDITEADLALIDRSYTSPFGAFVIQEAVEMAFTTKNRQVFENGLFFPSVQSNLIYNGLIRWAWGQEISIELYNEADIAMGVSDLEDAPYQDTLVPPLLRAGEHELELQLAVVEGEATLIRKVFAPSGPDLGQVQFGMDAYSTEQDLHFDPGPHEVTDAESASPDLQFDVQKGASSEGLLANFDHTESIWASFLSCASTDNAPPFLQVGYDLKGWSGPTVKMNVNLTAEADAPEGKHYFRILTSCRYDENTLLKERIVEVTINP